MKRARHCRRYSIDAIDEMKKAGVLPKQMGIIISVVLSFLLLIAAVELLTNESIYRYWVNIWLPYISTKLDFSLQLFLTDFLFNMLILILLFFLPVFVTLTLKRCHHSRRTFIECFVFLTIPVAILWQILVFVVASPRLTQNGFYDETSFVWRYALGALISTQAIGAVTTLYGLLDALGEVQKGSKG